jgi:membrane-associated phospholipid phosphatase
MNLRIAIAQTGFIIYYLFLALGLVLLILFDKGAVLLWLNQKNNPFLDLFFKYWTYLGDGIVFAVLIVFFLMFNYYRTLMIAFAVISQTVIIQGLKRIVFNDMVRPRLFFEHFDELHQVAGVDVHSYGSFPSGHTATAFTAAVLLSLMFRNKYFTVVLMFVAILVGISRIYLLQHFFIDIYFGSIIGFLNGLVIYFWMESSSLNGNPGLQGGLIRK